MYLWRKTAGRQWLEMHEHRLQARACGGLVIVTRPEHRRLQLEISCRSRRSAQALIAQFGGRAEKLPRDWLQRCAVQHLKTIKIGNRLVISSAGGTLVGPSRPRACSHIVIPACGAFGTGEHATTGMALRFLEQLTRRWKHGWSLIDLGTGTGILALAAKSLGAGRVLGLDNDPSAITIAKSNARLNNIRGASFRCGDVRTSRALGQSDVLTANLYCDLLIEILPKLQWSEWLIFSGILGEQTAEFRRALRRNHIEIISIRRRGKWVAVLAKKNSSISRST